MQLLIILIRIHTFGFENILCILPWNGTNNLTPNFGGNDCVRLWPLVCCSKTWVVERGGGCSCFSVSGAQEAMLMKPHSPWTDLKGIRNRVAS